MIAVRSVSVSVLRVNDFPCDAGGFVISISSVAAGQNTTFLLARPNDKFSDLPRHPVDLDTPQDCIVCAHDNGEDDSPLECDKVLISSSSRRSREQDSHPPPSRLVRLPIPFGVPDPTPGRRSGRRMVLPPLSS